MANAGTFLKGGGKMKGEKVDRKYKYTVGIAYTIAFRQGKNIDQICKFFKASRGTVTQTLKRHGVDLEKAQSKKIKKLQEKISELESKIAHLKK